MYSTAMLIVVLSSCTDTQAKIPIQKTSTKQYTMAKQRLVKEGNTIAHFTVSFSDLNYNVIQRGWKKFRAKTTK